MKFRSIAFIIAASLGAAAVTLSAAEKKEEGEKKAPAGKPRVTVKRSGEPVESEKVTYLGVETGPVPRALSAHLGLGRDMGLVVNAVADNSPASGVLEENDILVKLDDQMLVDSRQLSVLIRAKKPGDEAKLTVIRAGKQQVISAKLGEREVPRMFGMRFPDDSGPFRFFNDENGGIAIDRLRELPGLAREELNDVLRVIGRDRENWFDGPRVHVFKRKKDGSTILNMAEGNFSFSDDDGAIEINASNGERQLTVKDAKGKVTFQGPISTDEQRAQLPPEVKDRLKKLDSLSIDFQADESLEQEGAALKAPEKTKTVRPLPARPMRWIVPPTGRPF